MMVAWTYTAVDIFGRPDIGGLAKFLWLLLILFLPIIGMLIYFIARPDEFELESAILDPAGIDHPWRNRRSLGRSGGTTQAKRPPP